MASLINSTLKSKIQKAFVNLHDSFTREIVVYKTASSTLIATNPTYNAMYKRASQSPQQTTVAVSRSLQGRIYYGEINENLFSPSNSSTGEQSKIRIPNGSAILIVDDDGFEFLKTTKRVEVDGQIFALSSDNVPIGMFERQHHQFLLTPIDT